MTLSARGVLIPDASLGEVLRLTSEMHASETGALCPRRAGIRNVLKIACRAYQGEARSVSHLVVSKVLSSSAACLHGFPMPVIDVRL